MTIYRPILTTGEIYHVYDRTINKEEIFIHRDSIKRALDTINYYSFDQRLRYSKWKILPSDQKNNYRENFFVKNKLLVETYAYSLMPNHYHFLMKQLKEDGIRRFVSNFQNSFAKFYNLKNDRQGALFSRPFKIKRINNEEEVKHISRYIHINHLTNYLLNLEQLKSSRLTSFIYYANKIETPLFLNTEFLLKMFGIRERYTQFVVDQIDYQRKLAKIKYLVLEK